MTSDDTIIDGNGSVNIVPTKTSDQKKNFNVILVALIILAMALLATLCFLACREIIRSGQKSGSVIKNLSNEEILNESIFNIDKMVSGSFALETSISSQVRGIPEDEYGGLFDTQTTSVRNGSFNLENAGEARVSIGTKKELGKDEQSLVPLDYNNIIIGKKIYTKINDDPAFSSPNQEIVAGQWLAMDTSDENLARYNLPGRDMGYFTRISKAQIQLLAQVLIDGHVLTVIAKTEEKVSGSDCYRLELSVDKAALAGSIVKVNAELSKNEGLKNFLVTLNQLALQGDFKNVTVWMGKNDLLPRKLTFIISVVNATSSYEQKIDLKGNLTIDNLNLPISIEQPQVYKNIGDIVSTITPDNTNSLDYDAERIYHMKELANAQTMWVADHQGDYYTCSETGGDCRGRENNYPSKIEPRLAGFTPSDPNQTGGKNKDAICGQGYVYCALDNSKNAKQFCYYAKLERGFFYTSSPAGNFLRAAAPKNFAECSVSDVNLSAFFKKMSADERDQWRVADMRLIATAQELYYLDFYHGTEKMDEWRQVYYTCGKTNGDCQGRSNNFPVTIKGYVENVIDPLNSGSVCGQNYIYCGLDNTADNKNFCYYAKLEGGGYYTAFNSDNFKRSTVPTTFAECGQNN